jgi:hypothetical protein
MRTTVTLDDDVYRAVDRIARISGRRMGQVLSDLTRRGLNLDQSSVAGSPKGRFPNFDVPADARVVSALRIQQFLDAE